MTSCTKHVWILVFQNHKGDRRTQRVAANTFTEVLSYFNEKGVSEIVKVEKIEDEITFKY